MNSWKDFANQLNSVQAPLQEKVTSNKLQLSTIGHLLGRFQGLEVNLMEKKLLQDAYWSNSETWRRKALPAP